MDMTRCAFLGTLEPGDTYAWMQRLCQHQSNKDDEERLFRHKGDLPTTWTDTNFIVMYLGEDDYTTGVSTTRSRN